MQHSESLPQLTDTTILDWWLILLTVYNHTQTKCDFKNKHIEEAANQAIVVNISNVSVAECNWFNCSGTCRETQSHLVRGNRERESTTLLNVNQQHQQSRAKPEKMLWGKLTCFTRPPPQASSGMETWQLFMGAETSFSAFPRALPQLRLISHLPGCDYVLVHVLVTQRQYNLLIQKLYN